MKYQNFTIFGIFSFHITSQTPPRNTTNRKLLNFETDQCLRLLQLFPIISNYPCLTAASTSDHYSTVCMQYKMVKALTRIYKISVFRLLAYNLKPVHIFSDHDFFVIEGPLKHFERSTIIINLCCYISDHLELLLNEIMETDNEKMWMEKHDNSLILFNRISIWLNKFIAMKHSDQCGSCYYNQN